MARQTLTKRVEILEKSMADMASLPGQVERIDGRLDRAEVQFLQFRAEVRGEFSAIRTEVSNAFAPLATKTELAATVAPLATKDELAAAVAQLATKAELAAAIAPLATKTELAAAVAPLATRSEMLALHESLRGDIQLLADSVLSLHTKFEARQS